MIKIHQGKVSEADGVATLSTEIEIGEDKKEVRLSVESKYGKYFSFERADYAFVGMLAYALRNKHDIICETPVTDELLYNIRELLIPTFVRSDARNYPVQIQAEFTTTARLIIVMAKKTFRSSSKKFLNVPKQ